MEIPEVCMEIIVQLAPEAARNFRRGVEDAFAVALRTLTQRFAFRLTPVVERERRPLGRLLRRRRRAADARRERSYRRRAQKAARRDLQLREVGCVRSGRAAGRRPLTDPPLVDGRRMRRSMINTRAAFIRQPAAAASIAGKHTMSKSAPRLRPEAQALPKFLRSNPPIATIKRNTVPPPRFSSAQMRPPWLSMMARQIESPTPMPSFLVETKVWNNRSWIAFGKAGPLTATAISMLSATRRAENRILSTAAPAMLKAAMVLLPGTGMRRQPS
jgi:hypothetical protein